MHKKNWRPPQEAKTPYLLEVLGNEESIYRYKNISKFCDKRKIRKWWKITKTLRMYM